MLVGPANLYIGKFASTADAIKIRNVRDVQFNPGIGMAWTANDAQSGLPSADGLFAVAARPVVTASVQDLAYDTVKKLILGATETSSGTSSTFGAPDSFKAISLANVPSLFVQPVQEEAQGVNAPHGIWLPAVTISIENVNFGRVEANSEITQAYSITFTGAYREVDQGSTSIPAGNRSWFYGPPSNLGLSWSLS
jgi:hypothetical protein